MRMYVIWSNEVGAFERADRRGYTNRLHEAGRYTEAEAIAAVKDSPLIEHLVDPYTGEDYEQASLVMLAAPETVDGQPDPVLAEAAAADAKREERAQDIARIAGIPVEEARRIVGGVIQVDGGYTGPVKY